MIEVSEAGAQTLGKVASTLAHGEGLQAHARAAEVLAFHVESMVEDGDAIPTGGDEAALLEFVKDYEADGHRVMVASICVEIPSGKMRHVELDLPEHVAERIDR